MQEPSEAQVLFTELPARQGKIGLITLNRPAALNALSLEMVTELSKHLHAWAVDPSIQAVVIRGNGERAFCAGGDLKQLYAANLAPVKQPVSFFGYEYKLNEFIHNYPKPYIAMIHGISMGGGLGVSVHASHVIAAPDLKLAMPETGIGFYPDVGASYFLSRCVNNLGMYLGLTGNTIQVADAIYAGLVDACVPSEKFGLIIEELCNAVDLSNKTITSIISHFAIEPGFSVLAEQQDVISSCFSKNSVSEIIQALEKNNSAWAREQLKILFARSPTSLKVTHHELTVGAAMSISECIQMEFNLTTKLLHEHDIYEGIRAVLIDKTKNPQWQPATLDEVADSHIAELFRIEWKI